jgi:hypothetical protein
MTERNFGESPQIWIGIVTNVFDPHQGGRVQVRIFGRHDDTVNIPDADLPFAQVIQPVTSAARGRMGTAPVGLVAGSRVIGIWLDRDHQFPIILGSVGRAGEERPGVTDGGAPAINTDLGSIPAATQLSATNAYTALNDGKVGILEIDNRLVDIDSVPKTEGVVVTKEVEEGMQYAKFPTTAAADPDADDILAILNQVDPRSILSALQCFPKASLDVSITIDLGSIAAGFINMLADALTRAILNLMESLGINSVLRAIDSAAFAIANFKNAFDALQSGGICGAPAALNSIDAGTRALARSYYNIQTAVQRGSRAPQTLKQTLGYTQQEILSRAPSELFRPISVVVTAPTGYVQEYYAYDADPYPGYIRWTDPSGQGAPLFTLRNGQPNYTSAAQHTSYDVSRSVQSDLANSIRTGSFNTANLQSILLQSTGLAAGASLARTIGSGNPLQILSAAARLAPTIFAGVSGIFSPRFSITVLPNAGAVQQSVQRFTQAQTALATRATRLESGIRSI